DRAVVVGVEEAEDGALALEEKAVDRDGGGVSIGIPISAYEADVVPGQVVGAINTGGLCTRIIDVINFAWRAVAGDGPVEEHASIAGSGGDEVLAAGVGIADALPAGHWGARPWHVGWVVGHARHRIAVANQGVLGLPQRPTVPPIPGGRASAPAQRP